MRFETLGPLLIVLASTLSAFVASAEVRTASQAVAAELPDRIERHIDEKTERLPDKMREKARENLKEFARQIMDEMREALAEEAASSHEDSDDAEQAADEASDESEEESAGDQEEEAADETNSEGSKKLKSEAKLWEDRFKYEIAKYKEEIAAQRLAVEKSKIDHALEKERVTASNASLQRERDRLKIESELLKLEREIDGRKLEAELAELEAEKKKVRVKLEVEQAKEKLEDRVIGEEQYLDQPFDQGVLTVSIRRIELNGPIMTGAADYVCQRLDYFNNQSGKPIFLVIDNCPGGSAMEGMQIVQAIKESKAPVHVVVKRFAASMAAIIATLSENSYCYPDAIILHHQASTSFGGNGRMLEDQLKMFHEVSKRLIGEVADKVGYDDEKSFVDEMYENRASGDWNVFGDEAVRRGWVGNVVNLVREEAVRTRPTGQRSQPMRITRREGSQPQATGYLDRYEAPIVEEVDAQGRPFVRLQQSGPFDAWLLYNPNGYYRY